MCDNNMDDDDIEGDMDISWIQSHEKEILVDKNFQREPMEEIRVYYIYINASSSIEKITHEIIPTERYNDQTVIKNETLLYLIQTKRHIEKQLTYQYADIILYNVDLEPNQIPLYATSCNDMQDDFLKQSSIFNDIVIPDSIFIFHEVNTLYIIFKESLNQNSLESLKTLLKSRKSHSNGKHASGTKKALPKAITKTRSLIQNNNSKNKTLKKEIN